MNSFFIPKKQSNVRSAQCKTLSGAFRLFCTGDSPRLLTLQLLIALVLRGFVGDFSTTDGALFLAVLLWWPFQEWSAHLCILHAKPRTIFGRQFDSPMAYVHRYHHRNPWILESIFVPGSVILALIPLHALAWYWLTPTTGLALTGIVAYTACSLFYEWIHFFAHIPYRPKNAWLQRVQQNHRAHHFKNEHHWHAFTIPAIDKLFGTGPDPRDTPRSPTCKTLGVDDVFER